MTFLILREIVMVNFQLNSKNKTSKGETADIDLSNNDSDDLSKGHPTSITLMHVFKHS